MAKRRLGAVILLLCFCICMLPCPVQAASTDVAKEPIDTQKHCLLTITYRCDNTAFADQTIKLYKVADVSADFQYTLTSAFVASGLILNGVQTNGEWNVIRSTLEAYILANRTAPIQTATTDESGQARFADLNPGLYLAAAVTVVQEEVTCSFDSALVALPGLGIDGLWQYQVGIAAKSEILPSIKPDEEIQLKVLKLWRGDGGRTDRPQSIQVEIFCDGVSYETVTLSEDNHWSYSWTAKADGGNWKVVERNIPAGYTMTVEQRDTNFVLTNTRQDQLTPPPSQTGDTTNILFYTILTYVSGIMLIIVGIAGKRKRHEKTN